MKHIYIYKAICLHSGVVTLQSGVIPVDICPSSPVQSFAQTFSDQMPKMPNRPLSNHSRWFCNCFTTIWFCSWQAASPQIACLLRGNSMASSWMLFPAVQEQVCQLVLQPNTWWLATSKFTGKIQQAKGEWSIWSPCRGIAANCTCSCWAGFIHYMSLCRTFLLDTLDDATKVPYLFEAGSASWSAVHRTLTKLQL